MKRALLSVFDKAGIAELAAGLHGLGWELLSSGGTAAAIRAAGIPVIDVADHTGSPIMLGHRVVTLHPKIHGGILADRHDPEHMADLERHAIDPIDLVVVNLYPFRSEPGIEMIDIGGPTMVRAAAKNHAHVGVVVDPADYEAVLGELRAAGELGGDTRRSLARKAFAHTAAYDAAIVSWLDEPDDRLPDSIHLAIEKVEDLRYGENPHQRGARYREIGTRSWWDDIIQHSGLPMSYLNLYDTAAAWSLVRDLGNVTDERIVAIIKHANPCGVGTAPTLAQAYQKAYECDPRSAFGGIVALGGVVDLATVAHLESAAQADVIIAPGYEDGVVERLIAKRKNTRILTAPQPTARRWNIRQISGAWLVQDAHHFAAADPDWRVVTARRPTAAEWADAAFAWRVCAHVTSNAIVLAKDGAAWGIGAGQQNRVEAGKIAAEKAAGRAAGGASASDAFYPFPDGVEAAAAAGVAVVIQPGGAMRDDDVIARADELGLAMIFTGERQFLH